MAIYKSSLETGHASIESRDDFRLYAIMPILPIELKNKSKCSFV